MTGTVVVEASAWLADNQWILDLAAADPWIVGLVGHVDPNREDFKSDIDRLAGNALFRGIRCGSGYFADLEAGSFLADMEHLVARDLQLDALVGPANWAKWPNWPGDCPNCALSSITAAGSGPTAAIPIRRGWTP